MTKCHLFSASFAVSAQVKKQSILPGGQLFYYNNKNKINNLNQPSASRTISVATGKALKENQVVGINLSILSIEFVYN